MKISDKTKGLMIDAALRGGRGEMKMKQLTVLVKRVERGNQHGYTLADYAAAAADKINTRLANVGLATWEAGDKLSKYTAVSEAEDMIAECDDMFRDLLDITIDDLEVIE